MQDARSHAAALIPYLLMLLMKAYMPYVQQLPLYETIRTPVQPLKPYFTSLAVNG